MALRIAIIGAGNVGGTLGVAWANHGHEVFFGVRDASDPKLEELLARTSRKARAASVKETVAHAEIVALAVPWAAVQDALRDAGDVAGKILLDCDVGPLTEARLLEPFALVWIHLAVLQKMGTGFAFRLMRR
jgi:8-hydroxy-5-deazaflavin:NADPH oxidoreductase